MEAYNPSHGNARNTESCSKGIKERVATGMRKIDHELDTLFAQAEGPALAKVFMAGLNFSDPKRCLEITKELIRHGLTSESTATEAASFLESYLKESLASYGVEEKDYAEDLRNMILFVQDEGGFDGCIKPALKE